MYLAGVGIDPMKQNLDTNRKGKSIITKLNTKKKRSPHRILFDKIDDLLEL